MIPLRDENPSGSLPHLTIGLIAVNCAVFLYQLTLGPDLRWFLLTWGMVPARITIAARAGTEPILAPALTLVSSMFLHGGWVHLIGNMWYLWIFGDNVEDRLGRARFLAFYLLGGIAAALVHYATRPGSHLPTVGASGAIAAVLGGYAVTWPRARVLTLIPFFPFIQVVALPAFVMLGLWFLYQFLLGALSVAGGERGGVAWAAHAGGFVFGMIAMKLADPQRRGPSRASVV